MWMGTENMEFYDWFLSLIIVVLSSFTLQKISIFHSYFMLNGNMSRPYSFISWWHLSCLHCGILCFNLQSNFPGGVYILLWGAVSSLLGRYWEVELWIFGSTMVKHFEKLNLFSKAAVSFYTFFVLLTEHRFQHSYPHLLLSVFFLLQHYVDFAGGWGLEKV